MKKTLMVIYLIVLIILPAVLQLVDLHFFNVNFNDHTFWENFLHKLMWGAYSIAVYYYSLRVIKLHNK